MNLTEHLKKKIRDVPDFPKPGIIFKDITPVLQDHKLFGQVIKSFSDRYAPQKIDVIVGIESRGFIFGAPLAYELGCAFVPLRKAGKLPFECQKTSYELEYGTATVEMHIDAVQKGQRVLII
ncbi:MAG: adenine phosphoribosyltransferase, partial [Deltaproteobacteria bacterium]|nr:adenine phosphoribosyltransferase [Deltaproteobacteria bacterium]